MDMNAELASRPRACFPGGVCIVRVTASRWQPRQRVATQRASDRGGQRSAPSSAHAVPCNLRTCSSNKSARASSCCGPDAQALRIAAVRQSVSSVGVPGTHPAKLPLAAQAANAAFWQAGAVRCGRQPRIPGARSSRSGGRRNGLAARAGSGNRSSPASRGPSIEREVRAVWRTQRVRKPCGAAPVPGVLPMRNAVALALGASRRADARARRTSEGANPCPVGQAAAFRHARRRAGLYRGLASQV